MGITHRVQIIWNLISKLNTRHVSYWQWVSLQRNQFFSRFGKMNFNPIINLFQVYILLVLCDRCVKKIYIGDTKTVTKHPLDPQNSTNNTKKVGSCKMMQMASVGCVVSWLAGSQMKNLFSIQIILGFLDSYFLNSFSFCSNVVYQSWMDKKGVFGNATVFCGIPLGALILSPLISYESYDKKGKNHQKPNWYGTLCW